MQYTVRSVDDDTWRITITIPGPEGRTPTEDYTGHFIKFKYLIPKDPEHSREEINDHAFNIQYFYVTLRDLHPDKYIELFTYSFNHPLGVTENQIWMFANIYWGTGPTGQVSRMRRCAKLTILTIETDWEDLLDVEWCMRGSSSEWGSTTDTEDELLNRSLSSYKSSGMYLEAI